MKKSATNHPTYSTNHRLYVWVRKDLASMTPGKACAQVSHASSQHAIRLQEMLVNGVHSQVAEHFIAWKNSAVDERNPQTRKSVRDFCDFGTAIVLGAQNERVLVDTINHFKLVEDEEPVMYGLVTDPSYPITDGEALVTAEVTTVGWAFIDPKRFNDLLKLFDLY